MPVVDPGQPTSVGSWRAANSGSVDPAVLQGRITPPFGTGVELYHWHDFTVDAPSAGGNLFDVIADVDWTHEEGQLVRESQAFYTGTGTEFSFRFGAEKLGRWTGVTSSAVPELDGLVLHVTVTALTNPNRSGYHVFDPANPTWWMQQKGPNGTPVRIAPRLVGWDHVGALEDKNLAQISAGVDTFADDHGFTGAHVSGPVNRWFDIDDDPVGGTWHLGTLLASATPDPQTFVQLEQVIDLWCDKGGMVHFWLWADAQRDGASTDLPGGANGSLSQRLDRYIRARLGPLPGWSAGYGFDNWESISASLLGDWLDRITTRMGWFHWVGCRFVDTPTGGVGNPWGNCEDNVVRSGGYPSCSIPWNQARIAPPQYATWEQHFPSVVDRDGSTTDQDIIDGIEASLGNGVTLIDDRPHFSEDRFWYRDPPDETRDFLTEAEILPVLEAYGMSGWAAIYGRYVTETSVSLLSDPWPNEQDIKALNDSITAAMEGS